MSSKKTVAEATVFIYIRDLFRLILNKSVGVSVSLVDHAYLLALRISENKELVSEKIHLHNCLFHRHRLNREALTSDIELCLLLKILARFDYAALKGAASEPTLKTGLVPSKLP